MHSANMNDDGPKIPAPETVTEAVSETSPEINSDIVSDANGDIRDSMTQLDSGYILLLRLSAFIWAVIIAIPIFIGDALLANEGLIEPFIIAAPISMIFLLMIFLLPRRRYNRWGYDMSEGQIQIVRGYLFYTDTIVPFNRVQHIDVGQGPLERLFGLSSLVLHTAGTHNSTVVLPGLRRDTAEDMRDTIREYIKADML